MYIEKLADLKIASKKIRPFSVHYVNVTPKIKQSLLPPSNRGTKIKKTALNTLKTYV